MLVAGRTAEKIDKVVEAIRKDGGSATAVVVDGTKEDEVIKLFDRAMADDADGSPADLFVFNMGNNAAVDVREMTAQHFEDSWRVGCFAGFLFGREGGAAAGAARPRHHRLHRRVGFVARPAQVRGVQRHQGRAAPVRAVAGRARVRAAGAAHRPRDHRWRYRGATG